MRAYVRNRASPASQRSELSGMRLREYDAPSRVAEGVSGVVVFDADLADARQPVVSRMSVGSVEI